VPTRDLMHAPLVLMQTGLLRVAKTLELEDIFAKELLNFRIKVNISTTHASYEAWREYEHDDLVLAVVLPCRTAERFGQKLRHLSLPGYKVGDPIHDDN
jgi:hypothetical protein